jgi:Tol biopolymer transport system component
MNEIFATTSASSLVLRIALILFFSCPWATAALASSEADLPNGGWGAQWSPDGSHIAFLSSTPHTAAEAWVMAADGSKLRQLTSAGADRIAWASDGAAIEFETTRRRFSEIFELNLESGTQDRVAGLPPFASLPKVSPNRELFAFTAPDSQKIQALWVGTKDRSRVEMVTALLNVRSFFWGPQSRRVYFEAGKEYGVGIWVIDLTTMQTENFVNKYVGTPALSSDGLHIAYPYPVQPGLYDVYVVGINGQEEQLRPAPRMTQKWLSWDPSNRAIYYLGQELSDEVPAEVATKEDRPEELHAKAEGPQIHRAGEVGVWKLDLESGVETLVSPVGLHVAHFAFSPSGETLLLEAVGERSFASELYLFETSSQSLSQLTWSAPSWWGPAPSRDSHRIAYLSDSEGGDRIEVCDLEGRSVRSYLGANPPPGTRLGWLPESDALLVAWKSGIAAFADSGRIDYPDATSHRTILYAPASLTADKFLLDAIPRYGELPGLYEVELVDGSLVQRDLRTPPEGEMGVEFYLQPSYSTDGAEIAFGDRVDLWTMHSDGTTRRRITHYDEENLASTTDAVFASHPIWSRRGDRLCYTATRYTKDDAQRELWIVNRDGTNPRLLFREKMTTTFQARQEDLTSPPFFDLYDEFIFLTAQHEGLPNLLAVSTDRGKKRWLTRDGAIFPALLPEEDAIVYTSLRHNRETLRLIDTDGELDLALLPAEEASRQ